MTAMKHVRASDQNDFDAKNRKDFVVRKHGFSGKQAYTLGLTALVIIGGVTFLVQNDMMMGSLMCVMMGFVLFVFAKQIEGRQKELLSTEFLNALFSSALGAGYKFCIIVKKQDGHIAYLNYPFQQTFPDMVDTPKRTLETLLSMYYVSDADRKNVLAAIKQDSSSQITLQMQTGSDRKTHSMTLSIDPIERPSGFAMIRGKSS